MLLTNLKAVLPDQIMENAAIEIKDGFIKDIRPWKGESGTDLNGAYVLPGFIDVHVHGTNDDDAMDQNPEAIERISKNLLKEGTTAFLATTMTMSEEDIKKALRAISSASSPGARRLGVHLEGPFINEKFKGAQNAQFIVKGTPELIDAYNEAANGEIRLVTLAPEEQDTDFLDYLQAKGIVVSMGHSDASADDVRIAVNHGVKRVTHCYNGMSKFHHRDLGLTGMALYRDDIMAEIIADKIHTSPEALDFFAKNKPVDQMTLVTDSIRAKNLPDGEYDLGGQKIFVKDGVSRLEAGSIAGSTLRLNEGFRNMLETTRLGIVELAKAASTNPAKTLGIDDTHGTVENGKTADLTVLDKDFNVLKTMVGGDFRYER